MKNKLKIIGNVLFVIGYLIIGISFIIDYNDLSKFKTCYNNSFKFEWCKKYINY